MRRQRGLVDPQTYVEMWHDQQGVCAICGQTQESTDRRTCRKLAVDHNHETKTVRGLLCTKCNLGLGFFKDSPELLRAAMHYILGDVAVLGKPVQNPPHLAVDSTEAAPLL